MLDGDTTQPRYPLAEQATRKQTVLDGGNKSVSADRGTDEDNKKADSVAYDIVSVGFGQQVGVPVVLTRLSRTPSGLLC